MKRPILIFLAETTSTLPLSVNAAGIEERTLDYRCADSAVVGRVRSHAYDRISSDDDFIGHGRIRATIKVRRIVKGPKLPDIIPAEYVAHTYMRDDRDFMLIIRKHRDGGFEIVTGQLMSVRPRLSPKCAQ